MPVDAKGHNRTHAPQQIEMLSSSVGPFKEFGLVANQAPSPNYSQASHITVPGAQLSIRVRRVAVQRCGAD
jgi:hypothetical protein